jgi:hypothetical protein
MIYMAGLMATGTGVQTILKFASAVSKAVILVLLRRDLRSMPLRWAYAP